MREYGVPIRASSLAITRSAQSAKSLPPPTHQPWTWAITGFGERQTLMNFCVGAICGAVATDEVLARVPLAVGRDPLVPVVEAAAEVVAGAERAPRAAQHDHLAPSASRTARVDRRLDLVGHRRHDRVQLLGPVQRDRRDRRRRPRRGASRSQTWARSPSVGMDALQAR